MSIPIPRSYKAFRRTSGDTPLIVQPVTEELPSSLTPEEVLIRIRAVSLNYRDVAMLNGKYPSFALERGIPASDCAAEVLAIGDNVSGFKIGDRVAPIFDLNALEGTEIEKRTLGGDIDGVLREVAIFDQSVLVHLPEHLSWEEVSLFGNQAILAYFLIVLCYLGLGRVCDYLGYHRMELLEYAKCKGQRTSPR